VELESDLSARIADPADARDRAGNDEAVVALQTAILEKLTYQVGKRRAVATGRDWLMATAYALRDQIVDRWLAGIDAAYKNGSKRVYYLSLEFLIGRLLFDNLNNLTQLGTMRTALAGLDVDLDVLRALEPDAALGNGGLGRLAACYMESMATLNIPAHGYGIRYEHGLFRQVMNHGWQQEFPEDWLALGTPWEFHRPEVNCVIGFGGSIEAVAISEAAVRHVWHPAERIEAVAYDTPSVGWRGRRVNTLRLWSAKSVDPLRLDTFNHGDHTGASSERVKAESISKVLYPSDATPAGQELRLRQEYFFVSASLQDLVRRHLATFGQIGNLAEKTSIQLNDTHPAIGVAEMMRILLDVHQIPWEDAWGMTRTIFSYTNHTLLPEALEVWPVPLMERLLPRHMQIIYLINALHLGSVRRDHPGNDALLSSVSMIDEHQGRRVRMSHLAFLGSHRINGVSALHTNLMRETVFRDLHNLFPDRIVNVTNGIAFRRWLHEANPGLTRLLVNAVGPQVLDDEDALTKLRPLAGDRSFQQRFAACRYVNKVALAEIIRRELEIRVDPAALFDSHIKRIHEYKRQLLNILEAIALYNEIRARPMDDRAVRVKIFAGKAAASYHQAKLIIKLIHDVAKVINSDPTVRNLLKIVYLPNYSVSLAEAIIPASDVSEQISTAGMEASGTGNMKFALNGALTVGTLDGANVELLERVGDDNIIIFGLTADQVLSRQKLSTDSEDYIAASPILAEVLASVEAGVFSPDDRDRYRGLVNSLRYHDHFLVCADFDAYYAAQRRTGDLWRRPSDWWQASILNTANVGWFSSDRSIREYADKIWNVPTYIRP
jgi:starch phosphorylase